MQAQVVDRGAAGLGSLGASMPRARAGSPLESGEPRREAVEHAMTGLNAAQLSYGSRQNLKDFIAVSRALEQGAYQGQDIERAVNRMAELARDFRMSFSASSPRTPDEVWRFAVCVNDLFSHGVRQIAESGLPNALDYCRSLSLRVQLPERADER